jgi:FKBP-type peptidyl-prolyl cis-trans isomerase (trigger factor)
MKRYYTFLTIGFVLTIALITFGAYRSNNGTVSTSTSESTVETTENAADEAEFTSEKNELLSELADASFSLPPKLEEMGRIHDLPDLSTITIETDPKEMVTDELVENTIESIFTQDTGLPGSSINDDWVRNYADSTAETVDEFRQEEKEHLQASLDISYHARVQNTILDKVIDDTSFTLSQEAKDYGYKAVLWSLANSAKSSGLSIQTFLEVYYTNDFADLQDLDKIKVNIKLDGERFAKETLLIQYIAQTQGIEVSDAMIDQYVQEINSVSTEYYTRDTLIDTYGADMVNFEVLKEAVLKYLESQVNVAEVSEETGTVPKETNTVPEETETEDSYDANYPSGSQGSNIDRFVYVGGPSTDTEDYDDPDDFAEEWAEENADDYDSYEDAMDDAYDIWEEERGDD